MPKKGKAPSSASPMGCPVEAVASHPAFAPAAPATPVASGKAMAAKAKPPQKTDLLEFQPATKKTKQEFFAKFAPPEPSPA